MSDIKKRNNVYIGNRYVPVFANPVEWDNLREYEPLTIVTYHGTSYTSKKTVPVGTELSNRDYWVVTGNYNAQVEAYRQEVEQVQSDMETLSASVDTRIDECEADVASQLNVFRSDFTTFQNTVNQSLADMRTWVESRGMVIVDANGTGDYTTINGALNASDGHVAKIFVMPGTYTEVIDFRTFNYVCILGAGEGNTIIRSTTGVYKDSPIRANCNFDICNLTISAVGSTSFTPTYNDSNVENTYPAYAIHADNGNGGSPRHGVVSNCTITSTAGPAIGAGTYENNTLTFKDCTIKRTPINNSYKANDTVHEGAVLIHACNSVAGNQLAEFLNCTMYCSYGYTFVCRGDLVGQAGFTLRAIGNRIHSDAREGDCIYYTKGTSKLTNDSANNTHFELNWGCGVGLQQHEVYEVANLTQNFTNVNVGNFFNANEVQVGLRTTAKYQFGCWARVPVSLLKRYIAGYPSEPVYLQLQMSDGNTATFGFTQDGTSVQCACGQSTTYTVACITLLY